MQCKRTITITDEKITVLETIIFADIKTIGNNWRQNLSLGFCFAVSPYKQSAT